MPSGLRGEARRRGADPDVTVAVWGNEVRVVAGRSERSGSGQADTGGDSRSPDLGAFRRFRPGLGQGLDQPISRPPTPVGKGPKRVESVRRTHGNHDLIVEAAAQGRIRASAGCLRGDGGPRLWAWSSEPRRLRPSSLRRRHDRRHLSHRADRVPRWSPCPGRRQPRSCAPAGPCQGRPVQEDDAADHGGGVVLNACTAKAQVDEASRSPKTAMPISTAPIGSRVSMSGRLMARESVGYRSRAGDSTVFTPGRQGCLSGRGQPRPGGHGRGPAQPLPVDAVSRSVAAAPGSPCTRCVVWGAGAPLSQSRIWLASACAEKCGTWRGGGCTEGAFGVDGGRQRSELVCRGPRSRNHKADRPNGPGPVDYGSNGQHPATMAVTH